MTTLTAQTLKAIDDWAKEFNSAAGQALIDAAARSPYLSSQFNQFVASGGKFAASNDNAASAKLDNGVITIDVGRQLASNYLSSPVERDQLATVFAHEMGHAQLSGGMPSATVIPIQAVAASHRAEDVALTSEMIVSYQLGLGSNANYSYSDRGGLNQLPGAMAQLFNQHIALEYDAVSLWTLDTTSAKSFVNYSVSPIAQTYGLWSGQATPSLAPKLTYDQYNEAWAALNACGPENSPVQIDWLNVEPDSVRLNLNPDGSCRINTPKALPRLDGSNVSLDANLDPTGHPLTVSASVDLQGDGTINQTTTNNYTYSDNSADYQTDSTVTDAAGNVTRSIHSDYNYNDAGQETRAEYVSDAGGTLKTVYDDAGVHFLGDKNYDGKEADFTYTVQDANGNTAQAQVAVGMTTVNDAPTVQVQLIQMACNDSLFQLAA